MTDQRFRYETVTGDGADASVRRRLSALLLEHGQGKNQLARIYRRILRPLAENSAPSVTIDAEGEFPEAQPNRLFGRTSFLLCVVLPALLTITYFAFIATDQYVAEMRLVVRMGSPEFSGSGGLANMIAAAGGGGGGSGPGAQAATGTGGSGVGGNSSGTSTENAHILTSYITSRSIVDDLLRTVDLREIYTRPEADFYARLRQNPTREELREYWIKMVSAFVDSTSGIVTIEVRAFRPDDALTILRAIQSLSEALLNDISIRARQDTIQRATDELGRARDQMLVAIHGTEEYRNSEGIIDPVQTATETGKLLMKITGDLLRVENQLAVARRSMNADAPAIKVLVPQVDTLRQQVEDLRAQLAGNSGAVRNVAAALARYEEVAIKQKMAETLYGLAISGLEKARAAAEAQSVYLTVFVPPALPEEYTYPKRWQFSLLITVAITVLWSIAALIGASIDDHRIE